MRFKEMTEQAAKLEQQLQLDKAGMLWSKAERYAKKRENRLWCNARANFCFAGLAPAWRVEEKQKQDEINRIIGAK